MSEKWTKEQIDTAKVISETSCAGRCCDDCSLYKNSDCLISKELQYCPTLSSFYNPNLKYMERFKSLIKEHEHGADELEPIPDKYETKTGQSVHDYWRYMFSGMAMQGLLSDAAVKGNVCYTEMAIKLADELLKKLEV